MNSMNWNYPTTVWFGENRSKEIQNACDHLKIINPLIVTDPGLLQTSIIEQINSDLKEKTNIYSEVQGNPTGSNVINGVKIFNEGKSLSLALIAIAMCIAVGKTSLVD